MYENKSQYLRMCQFKYNHFGSRVFRYLLKICSEQVSPIKLCPFSWIFEYISAFYSFPVAQMVEHGASNAKIMGSIPRESKSW